MTRFPALFRFDTLPAQALCAVTGANEGRAIGTGPAAVHGDIYRLARGARTGVLTLAEGPDAAPCVAERSAVGRTGEPVAILASATFMAPAGPPLEALLIRIGQAEHHLLPLATVRPEVEYELVSLDEAAAPERFADIAAVGFLAGTHLALADGRQAPVERLRTGDRLLTRLNGAREIRSIERMTRRAIGTGAPVRIPAGTLNAARDLLLLPEHRLFVWQRHDAFGAGRAEVMVRAGALVDGKTITREEGGHVKGFRISLGTHEIVYAEGIAVESMRAASLGGAARIAATLARRRSAADLELADELLGPGAASRLVRASRGED